jgi:hypothetical protein
LLGRKPRLTEAAEEPQEELENPLMPEAKVVGTLLAKEVFASLAAMFLSRTLASRGVVS